MKQIIVDKKTNTFHLTNGIISYVLEVEEGQLLAHLYFGKAINGYHGGRRYPRINRSFSPNLPGDTDRLYSKDTLPQEYPSYGNGDFRTPAIRVVFENGAATTDFRYDSYTIAKGKPVLEELPATYANAEEAETLTIVLKDDLNKLELQLQYVIFDQLPIVTRSTNLINHGAATVHIDEFASGSLDFAPEAFEVIHLNGTWAKERMLTREAVTPGIKSFESKRGTSSHQQNPFIALVNPETTEHQGKAIGIGLVYSGNHRFLLEQDAYNQLRVVTGINPYQFQWALAPQAVFQSPEVVYCFSDAGLNGMSQGFHQLINHHLCRGVHQNQERPVLINNWEATYFDFTAESLKNIIRESAELGVELFVLDDGWFGKRNDDTTSLGDWHENMEKLPGGLQELSDYTHSMKMKFGLWIEPEMISLESKLYQQHPDWLLQVPQREPSPSRGQFVLDFGRPEVRQYIEGQLCSVLDQVSVDYIKWDMNRHLSDVWSYGLPASQQGEVFHRFVLGVYELLEHLTSRYPHILFEGCSGGGGRFDLGMLYYTPQIWTSDNTDAVARLSIQYNTSLLYPVSTMGAHVSAVPNHQTERVTSLAMRGDVAMSGVLGYELDVTTLSDAERQEVRQQIATYKEHRHVIQYGQFYRLLNPGDSRDAAWMFVSSDQTECIVYYFQILTEASAPFRILKLTGLAPDVLYQTTDGAVIGTGEELMYAGFYVEPQLLGDFQSRVWHLKGQKKK